MAVSKLTIELTAKVRWWVHPLLWLLKVEIWLVSNYGVKVEAPTVELETDDEYRHRIIREIWFEPIEKVGYIHLDLLTAATGRDLDDLGALVGLPRKGHG